MRFSRSTQIELRPRPCADQCGIPASSGMAGRVSIGIGVDIESRLSLIGSSEVLSCSGSVLRSIGPNSLSVAESEFDCGAGDVRPGCAENGSASTSWTPGVRGRELHRLLLELERCMNGVAGVAGLIAKPYPDRERWKPLPSPIVGVA